MAEIFDFGSCLATVLRFTGVQVAIRVKASKARSCLNNWMNCLSFSHSILFFIRIHPLMGGWTLAVQGPIFDQKLIHRICTGLST